MTASLLGHSTGAMVEQQAGYAMMTTTTSVAYGIQAANELN